jgi:hypothetical protein
MLDVGCLWAAILCLPACEAPLRWRRVPEDSSQGLKVPSFSGWNARCDVICPMLVLRKVKRIIQSIQGMLLACGARSLARMRGSDQRPVSVNGE